MSTNPYQAGSVDYYKYQVEQSKKKQADALQAQANETIASQSFQDAQASLQAKALQTGQKQTLDTATLEAQKQKTLDKYVSQILPGYGAIGPSGGSVTPEQKVYSIPVQDQQAKADQLRANYANYQSQNNQLQAIAIGTQKKQELQQQNYNNYLNNINSTNNQIRQQNLASEKAYADWFRGVKDQANSLGYTALPTQRDTKTNTVSEVSFIPTKGATQFKILPFDTLQGKKGDKVPVSYTDNNGVTTAIDTSDNNAGYKELGKLDPVSGFFAGMGLAGREAISIIPGAKEGLAKVDSAILGLVGKGATGVILPQSAIGGASSDIMHRDVSGAANRITKSAQQAPAVFAGEIGFEAASTFIGNEAINAVTPVVLKGARAATQGLRNTKTETPTDISIGAPIKASKDYTTEAQFAAKRAGIQDEVTTQPVQQKILPISNEVVNVPIQPTRFTNVAIANKSVKIPIVGGKAIGPVKIPEGINYKQPVFNPAREILTADATPIGMISAKAGKVVVQNSPLSIETKSKLVGQDISKVQDTATWIKSQQGLDAIKKQGVADFYHSPKVKELQEQYAIKNDPMLNIKGKKLQKALGDAYTQADALQTKKAAIESQLADVQAQIDSFQTTSSGTGAKTTSASIDLGSLSDLTAQQADLTAQLNDVTTNLNGIQGKIETAYAKYGTTRGDALGALQHSAEEFYKRGAPQKTWMKNASPADAPYPKAASTPNPSGELRATSTTDIFGLEKNPSIPSSSYQRLAGYNLSRDQEGLDPLTGQYFITKGGKAVKLKWEQQATSAEFDLTDVVKSSKRAAKEQQASDTALRSKKASTPFSFGTDNNKSPTIGLAAKESGTSKVIEIPTLEPKEPAGFQSVKRSIFDAEQSAKRSKSLGLGDSSIGISSIGTIGLGLYGATGAERVSKRKSKSQTNEVTDFLRYPGESLVMNPKQNRRTDSSLSIGSLLDTGSAFNTRPQKNNTNHINSLFNDVLPKTGHGQNTWTNVKVSEFTGQNSRQNNITNQTFHMDLTIPKPQPPSPRPQRTPPSMITPNVPLPRFGTAFGGKPVGKSSVKQRAVADVFFGGALSLAGDNGKVNNISMLKQSKTAKAFGSGLGKAADIFGPAKKAKGKRSKGGAIF